MMRQLHCVVFLDHPVKESRGWVSISHGSDEWQIDPHEQGINFDRSVGRPSHSGSLE